MHVHVGHSEGDDTEQLLDEVCQAHSYLNTAQKILSDYREFCKRVSYNLHKRSCTNSINQLLTLVETAIPSGLRYLDMCNVLLIHNSACVQRSVQVILVISIHNTQYITNNM